MIKSERITRVREKLRIIIVHTDFMRYTVDFNFIPLFIKRKIMNYDAKRLAIERELLLKCILGGKRRFWVMDWCKKWHDGVLIDAKFDNEIHVKIHFVKWRSKYDEWIKLDGDGYDKISLSPINIFGFEETYGAFIGVHNMLKLFGLTKSFYRYINRFLDFGANMIAAYLRDFEPLKEFEPKFKMNHGKAVFIHDVNYHIMTYLPNNNQ